MKKGDGERETRRGCVSIERGQRTLRNEEGEKSVRVRARTRFLRRCWCTEQKICTVQQTPLAYVYVQNYVRISWGKSHVYIERADTVYSVRARAAHVCVYLRVYVCVCTRVRVYICMVLALYVRGVCF